jgi:hypothetical protein
MICAWLGGGLLCASGLAYAVHVSSKAKNKLLTETPRVNGDALLERAQAAAFTAACSGKTCRNPDEDAQHVQQPGSVSATAHDTMLRTSVKQLLLKRVIKKSEDVKREQKREKQQQQQPVQQQEGTSTAALAPPPSNETKTTTVITKTITEKHEWVKETVTVHSSTRGAGIYVATGGAGEGSAIVHVPSALVPFNELAETTSERFIPPEQQQASTFGFDGSVTLAYRGASLQFNAKRPSESLNSLGFTIIEQRVPFNKQLFLLGDFEPQPGGATVKLQRTARANECIVSTQDGDALLSASRSSASSARMFAQCSGALGAACLLAYALTKAKLL